MPDIPSLSLSAINVTAEEFYNKSIFNPGTNETFEVLNGRLDTENYGDGDGTIEPYACQIGSFAVGYYIGFDRNEFMYAEQVSKDPNTALRIISAGLSANIWLPFDAKYIMFGVQAFFKQDAVEWTNATSNAEANGGTNKSHTEYWEYKIYFDDGQESGLYGKVPQSKVNSLSPGDARYTTTAEDYWVSSATVDSNHDYSEEHRYRFVSKVGALDNIKSSSNTSKGYHTVKTSFYAGVGSENQGGAKLIIPTGGVWILAIR